MGTIPVIASPPGAGQVLPNAYMTKIKQTVDFWGLTPRCYAYQNSAQTLTTSGTLYPVTLDAEVYKVANSYDGGSDPSLHDNATNNSRIYAQTAGKYEISGQTMYSANATGGRVVQVRLNAAGNPASGTLVAQSSQQAVTTAATATGVPLPSVEIVMAVGDYVEMFASQTSGGSLALSTSQANTYLRLKLTGA
ncbi:MAG: hypothetical protein ACXVGQ_00385 [Mycobacteriaceae bacterium]